MISLSPGSPAGVEIPEGPGWEPLTADLDGATVGGAVWRVALGVAAVGVIASTDGADHDVAILEALTARAVEAGLDAMNVEVGADQASLLAALHDAPVLSTFMIKDAPSSPPDLPPGFDVRPKTDAEYADWKRTAVEEYAEENLERCGGNRELALQRSHESYNLLLPDGPATPHTHLLTLTLGGEPAGDLWVRHHWPRYRDAEPAEDQTYTFDVQVSQSRRGQGLGRAAMLAAERFAVEAGDRQLGLNVFGGNDVATRLYRSLGYAPRSTVFDVSLG